jgi:DNA-binding HxlR family transcriptional regulator
MKLDMETMQALSSRKRIQILEQLSNETRTPANLTSELDLSKSTVSSHLSELVETGLASRSKWQKRRRVEYSLTEKAEKIIKGEKTYIDFRM